MAPIFVRKPSAAHTFGGEPCAFARSEYSAKPRRPVLTPAGATGADSDAWRTLLIAAPATASHVETPDGVRESAEIANIFPKQRAMDSVRSLILTGAFDAPPPKCALKRP
jgi:hypothetical protein